MRSSLSDIYYNLNIPMLITQSVTPVYLNNPAYTTLTNIRSEGSSAVCVDLLILYLP